MASQSITCSPHITATCRDVRDNGQDMYLSA